jgi:hypothetical protein
MVSYQLRERLGHALFYSLTLVLALPTIYVFGASCAHSRAMVDGELGTDLGPCSLNEFMGIGLISIDETTGLAFEQMGDGRVVVCVNNECKTFKQKEIEL